MWELHRNKVQKHTYSNTLSDHSAALNTPVSQAFFLLSHCFLHTMEKTHDSGWNQTSSAFKKKKKKKNEICCSLFMVEITPPLFPPAICFHPPIHLHEELTYRTDYSVNVLLLLIAQRLLSGNKPGHCF